jgi:hypothetical protein
LNQEAHIHELFENCCKHRYGCCHRARLSAGQTVCRSIGGSSAPRSVGGDGLRIVVLEGEDGVNVLKKKTAVKPVVEVRDKNNLPIAGVAVLFFLPHSGPGALFANGQRELSTTTDANGRAVAAGMRPLGKGAFRIQVRASYQGQTASTSIVQTNFSSVASALKVGKTPGASAHTSAESAAAALGAAGGTSGGMIAGIVGGVAAAGAGAGLAATQNKGSSQQQDCTPLLNQAISDLNSEASICTSPGTSINQCRSAAQKVIDDCGRACARSATIFPADVRQLLIQLARGTGITLPSACGF